MYDQIDCHQVFIQFIWLPKHYFHQCSYPLILRILVLYFTSIFVASFVYILHPHIFFPRWSWKSWLYNLVHSSFYDLQHLSSDSCFPEFYKNERKLEAIMRSKWYLRKIVHGRGSHYLHQKRSGNREEWYNLRISHSVKYIYLSKPQRCDIFWRDQRIYTVPSPFKWWIIIL